MTRALAAPSAATFTVNSTLDEPDSNVGDGICSSTPSGKCTLRAAVMQANVVNLDTTILVPAGTYILTIPPVASDGPETGDLNLTTPASGNPVITIIGAGASTTIIDANQLDRVFNIATSRTAIISGVTIRNGYLSANYGGGIYINNSGTLTVISSTLSQNNAALGGGGIFNGFGTLTVTSSTLSQNNTAQSGGGIFNDYGALTVISSTLSQNNGAGGGGILNIGALTVTNSTLSQNNSIGGGSIDNDQFGTLIVVNSTISQNKANNNGGGIYDFNSTANVYNTSIVFNDADADRDGNGSGGGVFNDPTFTGANFNLRNTLVAGNTEFNTIVNDDCTGTLHSYGRNLFGLVSGCTVINASGGSWAYLNSLNLLGPLRNNGGPTATHALLKSSNAIDGADPVFGCTDSNGNTIATDQRGAARVVGVRCDIGAFEFSPPLYLPLIAR